MADPVSEDPKERSQELHRLALQLLVPDTYTGSLKIKPTIVSDERVGATLGADYVKIGLISCLLAILIVLARPRRSSS